MTPLEHRQEAERLLDEIDAPGGYFLGHDVARDVIAMAQVHALLALGEQQT